MNFFLLFSFVVFLSFEYCVQRNCYFPEFLHTPTTSIWWSDISTVRGSHLGDNIWWRNLSVEDDRREVYLRYLCTEKILVVDEETYQCNGWQKIQIGCIKTFGVRRHTYMVEVYKDHRKLYQCLKFATLDDQPHEVFTFHQSKKFSYYPDDLLCAEENLIKSSILWIPDLNKYAKRKWLPCPITGGFQIKNMINHYYKEKCSTSIYVNLECDCIIGEGCEWNFNEADCNPFEKKTKSIFQCFSNWYSNGHYYIILVNKQGQDKHIVLTLKYQNNIEYPLSKNHYEQFQTMVVNPGLLSDSKGITKLEGGFLDFSYRILIRRSFGICDDEQETCEQGCKADPSNQLFCHRTCPDHGKNCEFINQDSCTFKDRYIGRWNLLTLSHNGSIKITSNTITFNNTLSQGKDVTLNCIRENNDYIQDLFILGMPKQKNGCRIRDVCVQLYQSQSNKYAREFNTNTLFYKISKSSRKGTDFENLCIFEEDLPPLKDRYRSTREKALVQYFNKDIGTERSIVKCSLYKMSLIGNVTFRSNGYWNCPVEISDYNNNLGSTGEFDNKLRIFPGCQKARNISWQRLDHECVSVTTFEDISASAPMSQIITYIDEIQSYFCWLILEKKLNKTVLFEMYLFKTPQCQYSNKQLEGVVIIKTNAWAHFSLTINQKRQIPKFSQTTYNTITVNESIKNWKPLEPAIYEEITPSPVIDLDSNSNSLHFISLLVLLLPITCILITENNFLNYM